MPTNPRSTRLDPDKIVTAALAVADRNGLGGMTLRMVGAELGADPTAIYRHFSSKDALVVAIADRLFGQVAATELPGEWRERFVALMLASRDVYDAHPTIVEVLASHPDASASLLTINELLIGCLADAGLDADDVGLFHQFLTSYVVGAGVLVASRNKPGASPRESVRRAYGALDPHRYPVSVALAGALFPDADDVFEFAIRLVLDAVTAAGAAAGRSHATGTPSRPA